MAGLAGAQRQPGRLPGILLGEIRPWIIAAASPGAMPFGSRPRRAAARRASRPGRARGSAGRAPACCDAMLTRCVLGFDSRALTQTSETICHLVAVAGAAVALSRRHRRRCRPGRRCAARDRAPGPRRRRPRAPRAPRGALDVALGRGRDLPRIERAAGFGARRQHLVLDRRLDGQHAPEGVEVDRAGVGARRRARGFEQLLGGLGEQPARRQRLLGVERLALAARQQVLDRQAELVGQRFGLLLRSSSRAALADLRPEVIGHLAHHGLDVVGRADARPVDGDAAARQVAGGRLGLGLERRQLGGIVGRGGELLGRRTVLAAELDQLGLGVGLAAEPGLEVRFA
jgi:hypothetical protein